MSIEKDLRSWSRKVLEVPNEALGGLPACPFAKKAWKQRKVNVVETTGLVYTTEKEAKVFHNHRYEANENDCSFSRGVLCMSPR